MRFATLCVSLLCSVTPLAAQSPAATIEWDSLGAEAVRNLSAYLAVNTANPPGNELAAARFLQQLLAKDGIEAQILDTTELGPGRANLYARYHDGRQKSHRARQSHGRGAGDAAVLVGRPVLGSGEGRLHLGTRRARHEG
ncbi:MAG TPA: hypothetical protein VNG35_06765 [Gemmatimonadales bacterium]|nr:hypothetical protein [Gemmatimonadales bacterium]